MGLALAILMIALFPLIYAYSKGKWAGLLCVLVPFAVFGVIALAYQANETVGLVLYALLVIGLIGVAVWYNFIKK